MIVTPRAVVVGLVGLVALAALDGNVTHWSKPVPGFAPAGAATPVDGAWAPPLPAETVTTAFDAPHHDFAAVDIPVPDGTPVAAMHAGTVRYVGGDCGLGAEITWDGGSVKACHGSRRLVDDGATVTAGQPLALSGSTGNSTGPHLHLEVRAPDGGLRCPGPLLAAIYQNHPVPDLASLPSTGCVSGRGG